MMMMMMIQLANSFEQMTGVPPQDGAVCPETCRRDLINNHVYIQLYVCIYFVY
jgi:hypothetical protein